MAFKFVVLLACALALANGSFIHGPMNPHERYGSQELRYPANTGSDSQGVSSPQGENIARGQSQNQQKTVQITSGSYAPPSQGKPDARATNPETYSTSNYNGGSPADGTHEQRVTYASTPSYNNRNGYRHSVSSPAYQRPTPVYGLHAHHSVPVYQYVSSVYGLPAGGSSYPQNGNAYSQGGSSSSGNPGVLGVPYSPAVAVSHMSYSSPVGISYAW